MQQKLRNTARLYNAIVFGIYVPLFLMMEFFIIGSRKHYSVDLCIALYVTPMVYYLSYKIYNDPVFETPHTYFKLPSSPEGGKEQFGVLVEIDKN